MDAYAVIRPLLFRLEPEAAHRLTLRLLATTHLVSQCLLQERPASAPAVRLLGLDFPSRIGLAAGLDKNAVCIDALGALGFGFIEVGTVTPRPQRGQPRPRLFRLVPQEALINRMGFPNDGMQAIAARLERRRYAGVVGVNIGVNATTAFERYAADFLEGFRALHELADYIAINVSSPNTRNLRDMQGEAQLTELLGLLQQERKSIVAAGGLATPILLKLSPDLPDERLEATAELALRLGADGIIAVNTTLTRHGIEGVPGAHEAGGLSGVPLKPMALRAVTRLRNLLGRGRILIGVGGISCADDYCRMREAGADLVQLYTGLVYRGPGLVREILRAARKADANMPSDSRERAQLKRHG